MTMIARAASLTFLLLLSLTFSLRAQDSLLGQHKIDLKLGPLPAAEALNILSARSKSVAQQAEQAADAGRAWEVAGAEQLEGIIVQLDFVATPVSQVITTTLGCIGFTFTEQGNRIVIARAARARPIERCDSVVRISTNSVVSPQMQASSEKTYSWQFASTSALEFIKTFSRASGRNIVWPYSQTDLLRAIELRVNVADMHEAEVLQNFFGCIGWKYQQAGSEISAFKADAALPAECRGFIVLR
jgi:hypothetical protein